MSSNYNVILSFAYRICDGLVSGIWASSVLSNYISVLEGGDAVANEKVGLAQAIQGTLLAGAALPAGWLASRMRRDTILRNFAMVQLLAIVCTSYALWMPSDEEWYEIKDTKFWLLCAGLGLWGMAQGNTPVLDALLADSVPTGKRLPVYTRIYVAYILSQGLGPAIGAWLFYMHGNKWSLDIMQNVMLLGMAGAIVPTFLLFLFDDDKSLGAESEGLLKQVQRRGGPQDEEDGLHQPLMNRDYIDVDGRTFNLNDTADSVFDSSDEQNLAGFESPVFTPINSPFRPEAYQESSEGVLPSPIAVKAVPVDSFALDISETETVYSGSSKASSMNKSVARSLGTPGAQDIIHRELAPVLESTSSSPSKRKTEEERSKKEKTDAGGTCGITFWENSPRPGTSSTATATPTKADATHDPSIGATLEGTPHGSPNASTPPPRNVAQRLVLGEDSSEGLTVRQVSTHRGGAREPSGSASLAPREEEDGSLALHVGGRCCCLSVTSIPLIMAITDCIMALASGMTIKFFPVFFKDEVHMSPIAVNFLYTCIPLSLAAFSLIAQMECKLVGRVMATVLNRMVGITLLCVITAFPQLWPNIGFMVPTYIVRFCIMNGNYPIQKSILMDWVPKKSRAMWNSVEAVAIFGWSGSAALGGWLIANYDFQTTFFITATMQFTGWMISLLLIPIVPSDKLARDAAAAAAQGT